MIRVLIIRKDSYLSMHLPNGLHLETLEVMVVQLNDFDL